MFPPSVEDWLPENHLARFIVEVIDRLDLTELTRQYAGRGSAAHHPAVLLGLLMYGYATGLPSSRKIERATYDSVAFRYIAANTHPDHDTLAAFRRRCGAQFEQLFVQVLMLAREIGMLKLGRIAVDGSKIKTDASRHSALSWGHIKKIEAQLQQEVKQLMALAESEDRKQVPDGLDVPQEIARRQERLAALDEAKRKLEERARERDTQAQAEYESKMAKRRVKREAGRKPGGKDPEPPTSGPQDKDQINLTDEESRIMKVGGGFDQCYNAQAAVETASMLIVGSFITQAGNDSRQIEPLLEMLTERQEQLGPISQVLADTGYFSAANVAACEEAGIVPMIAMKREQHHVPVLDRFTEPPPLPQDASLVEAMAHRLKTKTGRADYALRKQTVEPVFGIVKHVMKFRQFLVRGKQQVAHEWNLVALAWNLKRMNALKMA
ncbi:IS1182 family transposase [Massilia sp. CCM 8695]|uniref:IS1182 family transposase n=1 Tax=Massilia frigida TaxID=2609281 RepID=A0ABX0NK44_9BURK|nr:IS1182 family transposase [Massilia frigida]NHZ83455.1 IS1182 family transposase [Massilia frigida]